MTNAERIGMVARMRLVGILGVGSIALISFGCAETPRCEDRGTSDRPRIVVECNAGKVAVCGDDPDEIYDPSSGALLPVPPASVENGACDGVSGPCRPRPTCAAEGEEAACASGETAYCVRGAVREIAAPMPMPMPMPDAGPRDAGTDAGTDAGVDSGT